MPGCGWPVPIRAPTSWSTGRSPSSVGPTCGRTTACPCTSWRSRRRWPRTTRSRRYARPASRWSTRACPSCLGKGGRCSVPPSVPRLA
ncbi:hypothetical protein NKG94_46720 [Micromonospora sp. M12]